MPCCGVLDILERRLLRLPRRCLWCLRLFILDAAASMAFFMLVALFLVLHDPLHGRAGVSRLMLEVSIYSIVSSLRLPGLLRMERCSLQCTVSYEAGSTSALEASVRLSVRAGWRMLTLASFSLILYFTGILSAYFRPPCAEEPGMEEGAPVLAASSEDELTGQFCRAYLVVGCGLAFLNFCFLVSAVALIAGGRYTRRRLPAANSGGMKPEQIHRIASHEFGDPSAPPTNPHCSICLEEFVVGERIRYLPCHHHFHQSCIDPWLAAKASCPLRCSIDGTPRASTASTLAGSAPTTPATPASPQGGGSFFASGASFESAGDEPVEQPPGQPFPRGQDEVEGGLSEELRVPERARNGGYPVWI